MIVSDDQKAFVFFLYDKIEWTAGEASNGVAAQVGSMLRSLDSVKQFFLCGSDENLIIKQSVKYCNHWTPKPTYSEQIWYLY